MLARGLAPILDTARQSAETMIEEAAKLSEQRLGQATDVMHALQDQGRSMASWWRGVQALYEPLLGTLDETRSRMGEVSTRVEEALQPVMNLLGVVKDQLNDLAKAAEPPAFESPLGTERTILDLSEDESPQEDSTEPEQDVTAGTAVGLRRGPRAWWPEVSPSIRSTG